MSPKEQSSFFDIPLRYVKQAREQDLGDSISHAEVNVNTQLPVNYYDGMVVRSYQFLPAPTQMLVPPPEVVEAYQKYIKFLQAPQVQISKP